MKLHLPLLLLSSLCLSPVSHAVTVGGASGDGSAETPYTPTDTTITVSGSGATHGTNITLGIGQELHFADRFDEYLSGVFHLADGSSITGNVADGGNKGWGIAVGSNQSIFHIGTAEASATATIGVSRLFFNGGVSSTFDIAAGSTLNFTGGLTGYNSAAAVFNITGGGKMVFTGTNKASTSAGFNAVNANVENGTLQIGDGTTNGTFSTGDIALGATGNLVFNNTGTTTFGGKMTGTGNVRIATGIVDWTGPSGTAAGNALSMTIDVGAELKLSYDGNFSAHFGAGGSLVNNGTVTVNPGAGKTLTIDNGALWNGNLSLESGTLKMVGGKTGANDKTFTLTVKDGAIMAFSGTDAANFNATVDNFIVLDEGGMLDTGTYRQTVKSHNRIVLNGGSIRGQGELSGTSHYGGIDFFGDNTLSVTANSEVHTALRFRSDTTTIETSNGATLLIGELQNAAGEALSGDNLKGGFGAGSGGHMKITGNGTVIIAAGDATEARSLNGTTTIDAGATLQIGQVSGKAGYLASATTNNGTLSIEKGSLASTVTNNATLQIANGSSLDTLRNNGGTTTIINGGRIGEVTTDAGSTAGAIDVQSGTLTVFGGGSSTLASVTVADNAILELANGTVTVNELTLAGNGAVKLDQVHATFGASIDTVNLTYSGSSYLSSDNTGTLTFSGLEASGGGAILYLTATGSGIYALAEGVDLAGKNVKLYQDGAYVSVTMDANRHLVAGESAQELTALVTGDHSTTSYYLNGSVTLSADVSVKSLTLNGGTDSRELNMGGCGLSISSGDSLAYNASTSTDTFTVTNGTLKTNKIDIVQGGELIIAASLQQMTAGGNGIIVGLGSGKLTYTGAGSADIASIAGLAGSIVTVGGGSAESAFTVGSDAGYLGQYVVGQKGSLTLKSGTTGGAGITLNDGSTLVWGTGNTADYSVLMTVANNASITLNTGSNDVTFSRALSATGATYTKAGTGTLTLTQSGTLKGSLVLEEGQVSLGASGGGGNGIVHGTIVVGKEDGASSATLILAGHDAMGYMANNEVTSLTIHQGSSMRIDTSKNHANGSNQTFHNMDIMLEGGSITGGAFDMFGGKTRIHATSDSTISSNVRFRQGADSSITAGELGNGNIMTVDAGATLTVAGQLEEGAGNSADFYKNGEGTLVLQNSGNNYSMATHVQQGALRLDAGATLGTGKGAVTVSHGASLEVVGSTLSNEVQVKNADATADTATIAKRDGASGVGYSNVKIGSTGIVAADASARSGRSEMRDASIQIGENQTYGIENADLVNTLVGLQSGATVTLSNVSFNESSGIAAASGTTGATATLSGTSSLTLGTQATYTGDVEYGGQSYAGLTTSQLSGAAMGSGTLTLDLTNSLLMSEGLAGKGYLAITFEGFTAAAGTTFDTSSFNLADHLTGGFKGATPSIVGVDTSSVAGGTVVYVQFAPAQMPEPTTATLGMLGLGSLLLRRRRRV